MCSSPFDQAQLRLSTLTHSRPGDGLVGAHQDQKAELVHLGWEEGRANLAMSEETVLRALDIILDHSNYPICVLCGQGSHRTGTVVGCLRKLQRWNLTSIFEEYRRYAGAKVRLLNEQFIELFDTDLVQKQFSTALPWLQHHGHGASSNQRKVDKAREAERPHHPKTPLAREQSGGSGSIVGDEGAPSALIVKPDGVHQSLMSPDSSSPAADTPSSSSGASAAVAGRGVVAAGTGDRQH